MAVSLKEEVNSLLFLFGEDCLSVFKRAKALFFIFEMGVVTYVRNTKYTAPTRQQLAQT